MPFLIVVSLGILFAILPLVFLLLFNWIGFWSLVATAIIGMLVGLFLVNLNSP